LAHHDALMSSSGSKRSLCVMESAAHLRREVVAVANAQHGAVSLEQLVSLGMTERTIRRWVASRWLQRLHQGVYAVGHVALRPEGRWMSAVLACGAAAVLSHRSGAALRGLAEASGTRIDVTVRGRNGRSRPGIRVHSGDRLHPDEIGTVKGIPCTTVGRTILDLAGMLDRRGLEQVCERAVRMNAFDLYELTRLRVRHRGRRGVARLGVVLEEWDDDLVRARSELEVLFLRMIIEADIERPLVNRPIDVGGRVFEVDFHWPEARLIVETDGKAFHDNPLARKRDAERDRALARAGWLVERFGWDDVTASRNRTVRTVRDRLAQRRQTAA
jgi:very-short-patch-repair endonuclease